MPMYPYECECGWATDLFRSIHEYDPALEVFCSECHGKMFRVITKSAVVFGRKVGGDTGFYALDYGTRATEDITYPAKQERLRKDGRFRDPFADTPDYTQPSEETVAAFAD
jgi:predicted nucleic acid-binding Zn ribbon protein